MTVTAPPRPPRPSDPVDREEIEALVEALIEEARQRTRRRRRIYMAVAATMTLVAVVIATVFERTAESQTLSTIAARPSLSFAAGESKIAFIREPLYAGYAGVLWVMNPDGTGRRRMAPANHGARWSPDGQKIVFVGSHPIGDGIYVMNADGSGLQRMTSSLPGECGGRDSWDSGPAWSPDGSAIAFTRRFCGFWDGVNTATSEIYVINGDGSEQRLVTRHQARDNDPTELAWSPLGDEIAFVSRRASREIYVVNADGRWQRRLTRNTVRDSNPVWSPDGRSIAFERNWQVWVMNADGSGQRRLTRNGARNLAPAWSPDGKRIVFEHRIGRHQRDECSGCGSALGVEVHVMNADGSGERTLARSGRRNLAPSWSPDGRRIAFVSNRDGNNEVYVMNADGNGQRNLTRTRGWNEGSAAWSPGQ